MKQKLLKLMCLLCVSMMGMSAWAEADESIDFTAQNYSNQQSIESCSGTDFTVTFAKGSNSNAPKYYTSGTAIRAYGGNTVTVSSTTKKLASITFSFGSSDGTNTITSDVGTWSSPTWTGDASSVTFTIGGTSGNRRLVKIEVTYVKDSKTYTSLSWSETRVNTEIGNTFIAPTLTRNPIELTGIVYSSSNPSVASIDSNTGEITIKSIGTTTITATFAENETYRGSEASYVLGVDAGSSESITFSEQGFTNGEAVENFDANTFSLTFSKGSGTNDPAYYDSGTNFRLYANNTMTVSSEMPIYRVVITYAQKTTYTISTGTYDNDATTHIWNVPNAKSITCTIGSTGQLRMTSITVYTFGYTRTTTADNYGTICLPFAVAAADRSGATFYSVAGVTKSGEKINGVALEEVTGDLVAGTPYIFKATDSKIVAGYKGEASDVKAATGLVGNLGTAATINAGEYIYILAADNKMHKLSGTATATVATNRAYLNLEGVAEAPASVKGVRLYFDGSEETTAISSIENGQLTIDNVYNLQGQQLAAPQKGINIIGGKKVLVK